MKKLLNFSNNGLFRLACVFSVLNLSFNSLNVFIWNDEGLAMYNSILLHVFNEIQANLSVSLEIIFFILYAIESLILPIIILRTIDWIIMGFKKN